MIEYKIAPKMAIIVAIINDPIISLYESILVNLYSLFSLSREINAVSFTIRVANESKFTGSKKNILLIAPLTPVSNMSDEMFMPRI